MAKKTPKTSKKTPTRKTPRKPMRARHETWKNVFNEAILHTVIKPALAAAADVPLTSIGDYYTRFQERHQCSVSLAQFKSWLRDLNLIHYFQGPRQITPFTSPPTTARPLPPEIYVGRDPGLVDKSPTPMGGDDLVFDNEKPGFVPPEARFGPSQPSLPPELEAAIRGNTNPLTEGRPRTVLPGFDLQMDNPTAGALNLPGLTS